MFDYSPLQDLINQLEAGRKLHISVLFMTGRIRNSLMSLKFSNTIHSSPFCEAMKRRAGGLDRCMRCKAAAVSKAVRTGAPYGGLCINGIYEYCRPVVINAQVECIVFVGNSVTDRERFAKSITEDEAYLTDTVEYMGDVSELGNTARLVESYIRMALAVVPENEASPALNPAVELLKGHIDNYFCDDISLHRIAMVYHYNEKYLGRMFKREVGQSFKDYLNQKRIENACVLLKTTRNTVTDIAAKSGFNSVTYFNRVFAAVMGITPTKYRLKG